MASEGGRSRGGIGGIGLGGILVIVGIVVAIFWSRWLGILIALVGLIAFGGFARARHDQLHPAGHGRHHLDALPLVRMLQRALDHVHQITHFQLADKFRELGGVCGLSFA